MPDTPQSVLDTLHDARNFAALDPHDMLGLVRKFPAQCREASAIRWQYPPGRTTEEPIQQIVITGVGGSAIGGDFVRSLMEEYGTVPLLVNRDYTLPHYVGPHTLVIAASYSGNTEETLAAYAAAQSANAQIAVVTSGGKLAEQARADGHPLAIVPGGQPPRSATGYMFFPMLNFLLHRSLLERDIAADFEAALTRLENYERELGPDVPTAQNRAKQMAAALCGKIPVIYGSQGWRGAVATRWKGQFNENAKVAAFANVLPEQNHNEILAWTQAQQQAQTWAAIFLRDMEEENHSPRIARRVAVTKELLGENVAVHERIAEGDSLLERMFSLIYFADFVTVYLAYLYNICPTDIASIDRLKLELSKLD